MDENPYESPQVPDPSRAPRQSVGRLVFAIAIGLLALPAGAIACFTTCLATLQGTQSMAPLWIGIISGIAVTIGMCVLAVRIGRTPRE